MNGCLCYLFNTIYHKTFYNSNNCTWVPNKRKKIKPYKKFLLPSRDKETSLNKHFNKIGKELLKYERIILFGPSTAKLDFFDFLSEDERFLKLKIIINDADKMNVNQQHEFIKEYFEQN
jgi:stalled ribosome rescue protein Dom34